LPLYRRALVALPLFSLVGSGPSLPAGTARRAQRTVGDVDASGFPARLDAAGAR